MEGKNKISSEKKTPRTMTKKELMDYLGIKKYAALRQICERLDIPYLKGRQLFVPTELEKIITHWD